MTTTRPVVTVRHKVAFGSSIKLYRHIHRPFHHLMGGLYPRFASYTGADKGYSAFREDGAFIGTFAGRTLGSIRKNPLFTEPGDWFLRAVLAGMAQDRHTTISHVCEQDNYGTLRFWQRMGLGVVIDRRLKAATTGLTPESGETLARLIGAARVQYAEHRAYAARQLASVPPAELARLIPTEQDMGDTFQCSVDVTLL